MQKLIREYLSAPSERQESTIERMLEKPEEAFEALISFQGPYPNHIHVMDVYPDYIQPLLSQLIQRAPNLLIDRDVSKASEGQRWVLVSIAIDLENPQFAPIILAALTDTEDAGQDLAIAAVARLPFLRTPEAKVQLLKLARLKSKASVKDKIQSALDSFADGEKRVD